MSYKLQYNKKGGGVSTYSVENRYIKKGTKGGRKKTVFDQDFINMVRATYDSLGNYVATARAHDISVYITKRIVIGYYDNDSL